MDLYLRKNLKQSAENYLIISNNYSKPGESLAFLYLSINTTHNSSLKISIENAIIKTVYTTNT